MSWTKERSRVATLTRHVKAGRLPADDPELLDARRNMRAARLEDQVRQALAGEPALTAKQRRHIAAILRNGGDVA